MYATANQQLIILALSALCGICLGLLFDIFKIVRRFGKTSVTATNLQDGIFWILAAAGVFIFLLIIDNGLLRFYQLFAIFASWAVYQLTVSRYVVSVGAFLIRKLITIFLFPIRLICRIFKKPLFIAITLSRKSLKGTGKIFKETGRIWGNYAKNLKKMYKKI